MMGHETKNGFTTSNVHQLKTMVNQDKSSNLHHFE
jgi:hypothetical protein